jgi:hypothetical protein
VRRGRVDETKAAADELTNAEKGGDGDRGGGAEPERKENPTENGAETRTKRKLGFFFICALRERKEKVDNAIRDDGGGISMVHRCGLKNLLMVKVSLTND